MPKGFNVVDSLQCVYTLSQYIPTNTKTTDTTKKVTTIYTNFPQKSLIKNLKRMISLYHRSIL